MNLEIFEKAKSIKEKIDRYEKLKQICEYYNRTDRKYAFKEISDYVNGDRGDKEIARAAEALYNKSVVDKCNEIIKELENEFETL